MTTQDSQSMTIGGHITDIRYPGSLSDADALFWRVERDPVLRSTIVVVWVADRQPDSRRLENTLRGAVRKIPRLHQRVVEVPIGGRPRWVDDHDFDPAFHVRHVGAPGDGSLRALLDLAGPIAMHAFDRDRPLWELHLVEGMAAGRFGVILKVHHSLADGLGLMEMTAAMVETRPDVERREHAPWQPEGPPPSAASLAAAGVRERIGEARRSLGHAAGSAGRAVTAAARHPLSAARTGLDIGTSAGRVLEPTTTPLSPLLAGRSSRVRLDAVEVSLADLKAAGAAVGATVNDAFLAALAGAMRKYHERAGRPAPAIRVSMAVNRRDESTRTDAGNYVTGARIVIPLDVADLRERIRRVHAITGAALGESATPYVMTILGGVGRISGTGSARLLSAVQKATDLVASNLPGSPFTVYLSGAEIQRIIPFGPRVGAAANVTMMSYAGTCYVGINTDPAAVTDTDGLVADLQADLAELAALA
jgi:diacylglycerol O-acyltransferase / wax synthase